MLRVTKDTAQGLDVDLAYRFYGIQLKGSADLVQGRGYDLTTLHRVADGNPKVPPRGRINVLSSNWSECDLGLDPKPGYC